MTPQPRAHDGGGKREGRRQKSLRRWRPLELAFEKKMIACKAEK
jgi:hypothetical protein